LALLELLVQSGLRIEEASELTTFEILKWKMPDGRVYYLLQRNRESTISFSEPARN
jgi:site-specific recombinase XerD